MDLNTSVQYIKGVGPARFELLNNLGVRTVHDLLYYFPRRYEDRRNLLPIARLKEGEFATVKARVFKAGLRRSRRGLAIFQAGLSDASGILNVVWFNQPYLKRYFKEGQNVILYGKVERYGQLQMHNQEYEFVTEEDDSINVGRIVPIYPLTARLGQRYLRTIITRAIDNCDSLIRDILPDALTQKLKLMPLTAAIKQIHFPQDFNNRQEAYHRLVFDEFFLLQLALGLKKRRQLQPQTAIVHQKQGRLTELLLKVLPFELTLSQRKVIKEIENDMASRKTMNRLLQGDVGSGKTVVAAYAIALSAQSGFQSVLMAPTEILAEQHYLSLSRMLSVLGINPGLLIGSMSPKAKEDTLEDIRCGTVNLVIGTHALIEQGVEFKNLGLVVIDEQHKFGVVQRSILTKKAQNPDYLVITATPIPRTLALTVYGDLDISTIKELPQGRKGITSLWIKQQAIGEAYKFIREEVARGRQGYIVYPLIEHNPVSDVKAAEEMYQKLQREEFSDLRLGLIHGRMKGKQKENIMKDFRNHKIDILVATTVIEVGIDVANASVMMIEHAERFGLSQLHQLRGRIGRGEHHSYCLLSGEPANEKARQRFEAMLASSDGFQIAQQDLEIRGPGQFFGHQQHGLPELKIGNIIRDMELMQLAREEAFGLISQDPGLKNKQHLILQKELKQRFRYADLGLIAG